MSEKKTGGPAFPTQNMGSNCGVEYIEYEDGMTLRQYYKGQIIVGLLSQLTVNLIGMNSEDNDNKLAALTGCIADALIREDRK